jgi:hypothetical protein
LVKGLNLASAAAFWIAKMTKKYVPILQKLGIQKQQKAQHKEIKKGRGSFNYK